MNQPKVGKYRWTICLLLFLATTINYLDRQVLSLTWTDFIKPEFHWDNNDYGNITALFSIFYAVSMLFAGRLVDKLDTKKGFLWAIGVWSVGACLHAYCGIATAGIISGDWFVGFEGAKEVIGRVNDTGMVVSVSVTLFIFARFVLAVGEAGNFPAAIKATAEYFPKKDRAFATSIFNAGATVGALAAPITIPFIAKAYGWEMAFIIIGALGFVQSAFPLFVLYMITLLSIIGGWLPTYFVDKKGMNPYEGRMRAMLIFAFFPLLALAAQPLGHITYWIPVIIIGIAGAAHQAWSANIFSTVGDMFPKKAIATITGIGGMAGGIGSFIINKGSGLLFDYTGKNEIVFMGFKGEEAGYFIIFSICAVCYLIGWTVMKTLVPKYKVIELA
ncbi:MAG: MFS transporter [Pedobacter sp.]|nr:MAG: MFS transporter [Pedobacter sp.]